MGNWYNTYEHEVLVATENYGVLIKGEIYISDYCRYYDDGETIVYFYIINDMSYSKSKFRKPSTIELRKYKIEKILNK